MRTERRNIFVVIILGVFLLLALIGVLVSFLVYQNEIIEVSAAEEENVIESTYTFNYNSNSLVFYDNDIFTLASLNNGADGGGRDLVLCLKVDNNDFIFSDCRVELDFLGYSSNLTVALAGGIYMPLIENDSGYISQSMSVDVSSPFRMLAISVFSNDYSYIYSCVLRVFYNGNVYKYQLGNANDMFFSTVQNQPLSLSAGQEFVFPLDLPDSNFASVSVDSSGVGTFALDYVSPVGIRRTMFDNVDLSDGGLYPLSVNKYYKYTSMQKASYVIIKALSDCQIYWLNFLFTGAYTYDVVNCYDRWEDLYSYMSDRRNTIYDFNMGYTSYNVTDISLSGNVLSGISAFRVGNSDPLFDSSGTVSSVSFSLPSGYTYRLAFDNVTLSSTVGIPYMGVIIREYDGSGALRNLGTFYDGDSGDVNFSFNSLSGNTILTFQFSVTSDSVSSVTSGYVDFSLSGLGFYATSDFSSGYNSGFSAGEKVGYDQGYSVGYSEGSSRTFEEFTGVSAVGTILDGVFKSLQVKIFGIFSIADLLYIGVIVAIFMFVVRVIKV